MKSMKSLVNRPHHTQTGSIAPQEYVTLLGKGLDVDWSKTAQGTRYYNAKTVADFKAVGLSHVRIRVTQKATDALFRELDSQINDCLKNGLIPVLAYQGKEFKKSASKSDLDKVVAWWDIVAKHYKNYSPLLSFDIIIEVTDAMNTEPELLNKLYEKATAAIRKSNPKRIIFMSPRVRSNPAYLKELKIPTTANGFMMAEWHFYASGPSKTNAVKLWTTGTRQEKQIILDKIKLAKEWEKQTGILTWVGAWMAGDYNDGNHYSIAEQIVFGRFVASELDKARIPFAVNSDTKFYDRRTNKWIPEYLPLLKAILHPSK
jgi:hypothetical protein